MKMIKITNTHYIVVDDSEIKENTWCYGMDGIFQYKGKVNIPDIELPKKITHSTQPLDTIILKNRNGSQTVRNHYGDIGHIALSEVEESINGYSVEKIAKRQFGYDVNAPLPVNDELVNEWICGFKAHQVFMKDKFILTKEQLEDALFDVLNQENIECCVTHNKDSIVRKAIQSLLPPTEWEVTFDEQGKIVLL
jgi:hypothetical protein